MEMQRQMLTLDLREDDSKWPQKNKDGRQELEIRLGNEHISFEVWPQWIRNGADCAPKLQCSDTLIDSENRLVGGCD